MIEIHTVLADTKRGLAFCSIGALAGTGYRAQGQHGLAPSLTVAAHRSIGIDRKCVGHFKPTPVLAAVMRRRL